MSRTLSLYQLLAIRYQPSLEPEARSNKQKYRNESLLLVGVVRRVRRQ